MKSLLAVGAAIAISAAGWAADPRKAPVAANPVVELQGRISRVEPFRPGAGMPGLVIDAHGTSTVVVLGSFRYLMEQNFNPKAGMEAQVKGYKTPEEVVAIEVKLPAENKSIKLRDENGWPLWRRRGGAGHGGRYAN